MVIHNKKAIGLIITIAGLGIMLFWGNIFVRMLSLPFTGSVAEAKVIGFKTKGSKHIVKNNNGGLSGRSPFFEFVSEQNDTIKVHSNAPQIFVLFNYEINENISVGYPTNEPQKAIILSWKEYPGIFLMLAMGLLCLAVGKSYLFQKALES
jgi:hypothetical protein